MDIYLLHVYPCNRKNTVFFFPQTVLAIASSSRENDDNKIVLKLGCKFQFYFVECKIIRSQAITSWKIKFAYLKWWKEKQNKKNVAGLCLSLKNLQIFCRYLQENYVIHVRTVFNYLFPIGFVSWIHPIIPEWVKDGIQPNVSTNNMKEQYSIRGQWRDAGRHEQAGLGFLPCIDNKIFHKFINHIFILYQLEKQTLPYQYVISWAKWYAFNGKVFFFYLHANWCALVLGKSSNTNNTSL
jgi:hypothetical protein